MHAVNRFSRAFPALAGSPSAFCVISCGGEDLARVVRSSFFPLVELCSRKWMERRVRMGACSRIKCSNDVE